MIKAFVFVALIGIVATLVMDVGGGALRASGITAGAPPELIGKWIHSALSGNFFIHDIRTSPGEPVALGRFLTYHYVIGILLAFVFYLIVRSLNIERVAWWMPLVFGLATTLIPALLMFPGMGFGVFGLQGPREYLLLRTAVLNHFCYGIGLMIGVKLLWRYTAPRLPADLAFR
jgi:hypothetical protein